jgi:hypothetical protein
MWQADPSAQLLGNRIEPRREVAGQQGPGLFAPNRAVGPNKDDLFNGHGFINLAPGV